jgi:hypothetical protein
LKHNPGDPRSLEIDPWIARANGGLDDPTYYIGLCRGCNGTIKQNLDIYDFFERLYYWELYGEWVEPLK